MPFVRPVCRYKEVVNGLHNGSAGPKSCFFALCYILLLQAFKQDELLDIEQRNLPVNVGKYCHFAFLVFFFFLLFNPIFLKAKKGIKNYFSSEPHRHDAGEEGAEGCRAGSKD